MATLKERSGNYSIRFVQTKEGKKQSCQFSLKTKRKRIAEKLQRKLEVEQESGQINVFNNFDFLSWRDGTPSEDTTSNKYLLSQSIEAFISDRTDMGSNSRKNYHQLLKAFNNHVGITMFTELIQKKDIQEYCFRDSISISTQNNYLTHLKVFFKWVEENEHGLNMCKGIRKKTVPENVKDQILTEIDLKEVLKLQKEHITEQKTKGYIFSDSRSQLWFEPLIRFAYKTGLRKNEIRKLKWKDIDLADDLITVVAGKGGKSRTIILDSELKKMLLKWKSTVNYGESRYVFESPNSINQVSKKMR